LSLTAPSRPPLTLHHRPPPSFYSGHSGAFHVWDEVAGAGEAAFTYVPRELACCCGHMAPVVDSSWWVFRELDVDGELTFRSLPPPLTFSPLLLTQPSPGRRTATCCAR